MREQIYATFVLTKNNYSSKKYFSNVGITKCKEYRFDYSIPRKCKGKKPSKQFIRNKKNKNNQQ